MSNKYLKKNKKRKAYLKRKNYNKQTLGITYVTNRSHISNSDK